MSSTDDRIVRMIFDNASFKKGAADTQKSLADINAAADAAGNSKGLMNLESSMGRVQVSASKMSVVVGAALATITSKAVNAGLALASALTINPIAQGFHEYEELLTKQNVIMNATGKSANEVKGYLDELNKYSDETIYSFSNMTASITKFVNAGISLPQAVTSIKGIANSAAFAGATTEEANRAMVAFSQSMSTGYIMLNDWMQIENANMATMGFKEELLKAGVAAGTLTQQGNEYITTSGKVVTATAGWREGLQEQWASTEVMNTALAKYTDLNTKLGRQATEAATEVRTFTAFMDTLKESLGSGWSAIFTALFGNLNQATAMWTGLSDAVGNVVGNFFDFLSTALKVWRQMGGFEKTMEGFKNILAPIGRLFTSIGKAWRRAFPDSGGKGAGGVLYSISAGFAAITSPLQLVSDLIHALTPVFKAFFQILKIGKAALSEAAGFIGGLVEKAAGFIDLKPPSGGGFLGFIMDVIQAVRHAINRVSYLLDKGKSLGEALSGTNINLPDLPSLPSLPSMPDMPSLPSLPSLSGIFGGDDGSSDKLSAMASGVDSLKSSVLGLNDASASGEGGVLFNPDVTLDTSRMGEFTAATESAQQNLNTWADRLKSLGSAINSALGSMVDNFASFIKGFSIQDLVGAFNMSVLTTFVVSAVRLMGALRKGFSGFAGIGSGVTNVLKSASGALDAYGNAQKAKLITAYAIAIGILAVSLFALSFVPAKKLAAGLAAIGTLMAFMVIAIKQLSGAVEGMTGIGAKMISVSIALAGLAFAMLLLAGALLILQFVKWESIGKGLLLMTAMMLGVTLMGERMNDAAAKNLLGASVAMLAIAWAMVILAGALILFAKVKWESLAKAGVTLAAVAIVIGILGRLPASSLLGVAVAALTLSGSMLALAFALLIFETVEWSAIAKLAVVLGTLSIALALMMLVGGPVAVSGMIGLGLGMIAIATAGMILNSVDWSSIGKLALVMGIFVLAIAGLGVVAIFAAGPIALLGGAILLLGAGVALFGLGVALFVGAMATAIALGAAGAVAFAAIATAAAVAIGVFLQTLALQAPIIKDALLTLLQELINGIVEAVPMIIKGIKDLWNAIVKELSGGDKKQALADTGQSWISKLADGIKKNLPEIIRKGAEILVAFLKGLRSKAGDIAAAGIDLVISVLKGIERKIVDLIDAGVDLALTFLEGIGKAGPRLLRGTIDIIGQFLHDTADAIRSSSGIIGSGITDIADAFFDVGVDIIEGLGRGIASMGGALWDYVMELVGQLPGWAKKLLGISSPSKVFMEIGKFVSMGLAKGIQDNASLAIVAVASTVSGQIAVANELINKMIQDMDQKVIAARAKADGLAAAAARADKLAQQTKSKKDDKAAKNLSEQAAKADKAATAREKEIEAAKARQDRAKEFRQADLLGKAQMKSEDAQKALDAVKNSERKAAAALIEAAALEKQAKAAGVTAKQRKALMKEADKLREQSRADAKRANEQLKTARENAAEALKYQRQAGRGAAKSFQEQFKDAAEEAARTEAFDNLTDAQKAVQLREEAARLQERSERDLKKAKKLAFTDIKGANALAQLALSEAEASRQALRDATRFENSNNSNGGQLNEVINLDPSATAAAAFQQYADLYSMSMAAAATTPTVQFTQNNTSPESLDPSTIYRQTNNLITYASTKLQPTPA